MMGSLRSVSLTLSLCAAACAEAPLTSPDGGASDLGATYSGMALTPTRSVETARLKVGRSSHTATLLPSGKVLVAGGEQSDRTMIASVELFDPQTGAFTELPPLPEPRSNHTASVLPDGSLLIVGGGRANAIGLPTGLEVLRNALRYDPETGVAVEVSSPAFARHAHQAVTLPSGNVLLIGGAGDQSMVQPAQGADNPQPFGNALKECELFDVATQSFRNTGSLTDSRYAFTAVRLLDGRVLVTGGANYDGGAAKSLASSELYDERDGTFVATGALDGNDRLFHAATELAGGGALIFGGKKANRFFLSDAQLFDDASGTFTRVGSATPRRTAARAVPLRDGGAALIGGFTCPDPCEAVYATSLWSGGDATPGPDLLFARSGHTTTVLHDGSILVVGGYGFFAAEQDSAELLLP